MHRNIKIQEAYKILVKVLGYHAVEIGYVNRPSYLIVCAFA